MNFSLHSSVPVDKMLYSITTDKDSMPKWKKLDGRFVRQNEPKGDYRTNVFLDPIMYGNKVVMIETKREVQLKLNRYYHAWADVH